METALDIGITEADFWGMTLGEVTRAVNSYNRMKRAARKETAVNIYNLANLIGVSNARIYSKDAKYPQIYEAFPTLFNDKETEIERQKERNRQNTNNFKKFALSFNQRFKRGD